MKELTTQLKLGHLGLNTISQIIGFESPPAKFKEVMKRDYTDIDVHLFELAQFTNKKKEEIFF